MEWLDKLREIKDQLDFAGDVGADYLRKIADAMRKVAEAADGAADSIDPTPSQFEATADTSKVEEFVSECESEMSGPRVRAGGQLIGILLPIFLEIARKWLENRRPGGASAQGSPGRPAA